MAPVGDVLRGDLPWINVKDPAYGAKGDGTTDDSAAIRAAAAAANAVSGALLFPPGVYGMASEVATGANLRAIVGFAATIKRLTTAATKLFRINSAANTQVTGLIVDGNRGALTIADPTQFVDILQLGGKSIISGNRFLNAPGSSVAGQASAAQIFGNHFENWRDHAVYFSGTAATSNAKDILVTSNVFVHDSSTENGCIKFRNNVVNWTVSNNVVDLLCSTPFVQDDRSGTAGLGDELNYTNKRGIVTGNSGECVYFYGTLSVTPLADLATFATTTLSNNTVKCTFFAYLGDATYPGLGSLEIIGNNVDGVMVRIVNVLNTISAVEYANRLVMKNNAHTGRAISAISNLPRTVVYQGNDHTGTTAPFYFQNADTEVDTKTFDIVDNRSTVSSSSFFVSHSTLAPNTTLRIRRNRISGFTWIIDDLANGPLTVEIEHNETTGGGVTTPNNQEFSGGPGRVKMAFNKFGGRMVVENSASKSSCMLTRYNLFVHDNEAPVANAIQTSGTPITSYAGSNRLYHDRNWGVGMTVSNGYGAGVKAVLPVVAL